MARKRAQHQPGYQPSERERERCHHRQRDGGLDEQRMQVDRVCVLRRSSY